MDKLSLNDLDFSIFPLPPPWRKKLDAPGYVNEITSEECFEHPAEKFFRERQTRSIPSGTIDIPETSPPLSNIKEEQFHEYRCTWQESGLFGDQKAYGLTIRYFLNDDHTELRFDDVDGEWKFSALEGPRGPLDKDDLFIGSKIRVFGRHISISFACTESTAWIENRGKKLRKEQEWLQERIESVGAIPVVRRAPPVNVRNISRSSAPSGSINLRKLVNENSRLGEQMAKLGLSHFLASKPV